MTIGNILYVSRQYLLNKFNTHSIVVNFKIVTITTIHETVIHRVSQIGLSDDQFDINLQIQKRYSFY